VAKKKKFNDEPFAYHAEIELEIATLTNLGLGLGRVQLPGPAPLPAAEPAPAPGTGGWVVMVPFTVPGERVRARVYRNHRNYSEADLVEVLTPSPERVRPRCPLFGRCGGCQYQHLNYAAQLAWKQRQVAELLKHLAGIEFPVAPVVASPHEYGYRSKITPHFNPPSPRLLRATPHDGEAAATVGAALPTQRADAAPFPIGFLRQGTRFDLVDVPHCPIATDAINLKLGAVREAVHARRDSYKRGATLLLREAGGVVTTDYDAIITETVGDLKIHFLARDFFQNNPFILPAFTRYVREQAAASGARFLVDAYCGSGLFALSAAPAFDRVAGVEISQTSVGFARENAAANRITNATFLAADAAAIFAGLGAAGETAGADAAGSGSPVPFPAGDTVVIVDPPRRGCDVPFLDQLFTFGPRAVVYVSCDPATQMRDLRRFLDAGYRLTAVQPFDLFPQTRHLECVLTLLRG
jgi:tRNA/tmRNA/rRNA uracil-C5-methylase (TrmA/RlmC/RlmD family)